MTVNKVTIAEIAEINPRLPSDLAAQPDREVNFVPMSHLSEQGHVRSNGTRPLKDVVKGYTYFQNGDVLVAKITPCMENGKAAFVSGLPYETSFGSTEFHVLRPGPKLDGRYLFYMIWNPAFRHVASRNMTGTAGQKRVPKSFIERFQIPLPPLSEQKRIADILDKADAIRRKRQDVIEQVDDLIQAGFVHIVGPSASVYESWPILSIEQLARPEKGAMRTGPFGSDLRHSEFVDEGIAVLGIDNAVHNRFAWAERRFITEDKYDKLKRYTVYPGDVLITIMATTGRSAVVPDDIPRAINTKHLACITLNRDVAEPEFVSNAIHRHPDVLAQIGVSHRGAIMPGLNLNLIKGLQLPTPPIEVQKEFADFVARVRSNEHRLNEAAQETNDLFNSLVQRAFKGQL